MHARVLVAACALACAGCSSDFGMPDPVTKEGGDVSALWRGAVWTAIAVGGITLALILYAAIRFRARGEEGLPKQTHANVPLEIVYTAVPLLIVAALFGFTLRVQHRILADRPGALVVDVSGFQWGWGFRYQDTGIEVSSGVDAPEIVLPVGRPVRFRITSPDVIHSFYVPRFLFKYDAIPGKTNEFDVTIEEPGTYGGKCAEFCGVQHVAMNFSIRAVAEDEYAAWVAAQR